MKLELSHPFNKEIIVREDFSISNESNYRDAEFFIIIRERLDENHKSPLDSIVRTDAHLVSDFGKINIGEIFVEPDSGVSSYGTSGIKWRTYTLVSTNKVKKVRVI